MAKSRSFLDIQGTHQGTTFVHSRTYGNHIRAARGTHKPAVVNDSFILQSSWLQAANVPAKMVNDALDPYREHFKGGPFWQRLVSQFRKQLQTLGKIDFSRLEPVDVHQRYPLGRLLHTNTIVHYNPNTLRLQVQLSYASHPESRRLPYVDGYRVGVIGIFPDLSRKSADTTSVWSPILSLNSGYDPLILQVDVPANATSFVICLKAEGCAQGKVCNQATTKGMRIVMAGELPALSPYN